MFHRRLLHAATAVAIGLGALVGGGPQFAAVSAAQPNWDMIVLALPGGAEGGSVGPNRPFLHQVTIINDGPSNIPALYLQHGISGWAVLSAEPSQGTCEPGPVLSCSLGALAANAPDVVVDILYSAPASGSVTIEYVATTVGASEEGRNSRGYSLPETVVMNVLPPDDFDGMYFMGQDRSIATTPLLSQQNPHSTQLDAPPWARAATVADTDSTECPVATCIGQASEMKLYGTPSATLPVFSVVVGFHASELPRGVNQSTLRLHHYPDTGPHVGTGYEIPRCGKIVVAPCFTAVKLRDGSLQATVSLTNNGVIRGWS